MSRFNYPDRVFSLSDCHGGQPAWNPLKSPDIAARLAEAIRSDLPGLQHFDTYGAPERLHDHIVREALRLHRESPESDTTGLFINSAPRTKENVNGEPFYRAEFDENVRIAVTPLSALSAVRDSVKRLLVWPNNDNGVYDGTKEQHRSSWAVRLLADNHGLDLQEVDTATIPELPEGCTLTYVDRFGNLVLFENGTPEVQSVRSEIAEKAGGKVKLKVGRYACTATVGRSLPEAEPGDLVVYANDGSIEILRKWKECWKLQQKFRNSAWSSYDKPRIGAECEVQELNRSWRESVAGVLSPRRAVASR